MNWQLAKNSKVYMNVIIKRIIAFHGGDHGMKAAEVTEGSLEDDTFRSILADHFFEQLREDSELLDIASTEFDEAAIAKGELTPVFFGSALTNFGVEPFLSHFLNMTTSPLPREASVGEIDPLMNISAFVFADPEANMNKAHRDRIVFMRICSGKFEREWKSCMSNKVKKSGLHNRRCTMAQDREIVEEAYAGDVIGVFDPGILAYRDTFFDASYKFEFKNPNLPRTLCSGYKKDTRNVSNSQKVLRKIAQEGAIQGFQQNRLDGRNHRRRCWCSAI